MIQYYCKLKVFNCNDRVESYIAAQCSTLHYTALVKLFQLKLKGGESMQKKDKWIANVVGRMHVGGITGKQLAAASGYTASYLSTVLNGKKGNDDTHRRIEEALRRLERAQ